VAGIFSARGSFVQPNARRPRSTLTDGRVWKNLSNPHVARVAQELDDFRARFAYNLEDGRVRALAAEVPILAQWDDYETHNNWWPGQQLEDDRYQQRNASSLSAYARRAAFEWTPIGRSNVAPGGATAIQRVMTLAPIVTFACSRCRRCRSGARFGLQPAFDLIGKHGQAKRALAEHDVVKASLLEARGEALLGQRA
jgi:phosphodiesterase/alkaline phosphatase D-like protein